MLGLSNKALCLAIPDRVSFLSFKLGTHDGMAQLAVLRGFWWHGRGQAIGIRLGMTYLNSIPAITCMTSHIMLSPFLV